MTPRLTHRQAKVLHLVIASINERGLSPTIRELMTAMGITSTNGVNDHLRRLVVKGYLRREYGAGRSLVPLLTPEGEPVEVAVLTEDEMELLELLRDQAPKPTQDEGGSPATNADADAKAKAKP